MGEQNNHALINLKGSTIWIYGKGGSGIRTAKVLIDSNFKVSGFIDKRANDISDSNLPTITLDNASKFLKKDNIVVIVCLKNVFLHESVVRNLLTAGFHNVIFKPISYLRRKNVDKNILQIDDIYECLVEHFYLPDFDCFVPFLDCLPFNLEDKFFISNCGNTVVSWVPVELVFNYKNSSDYPGCNMPLLFPLIGLYKAFMGGINICNYDSAIQDFYLYCGEWLHKNSLSEKEKPFSSFLDSRAGVFQYLEIISDIEPDFFQKNAPCANFENDKFYLVSSGRNRIAFQIAKGAKYVPLRLSREDYTRWCNFSMVNSVNKRLEFGDEFYYFAPASHPYLVSLPYEFADYISLFVIPSALEIIKKLYLQCVTADNNGIKHVDFELFEELKKKIRIVEHMSDDGVLRKYFLSLGIEVISNIVSCSPANKEDIYFYRGDDNNHFSYGYCLCKDSLPNWFNINKDSSKVMFIANGRNHRYIGVKVCQTH